jgi:preprotein translocase subunit SecE
MADVSKKAGEKKPEKKSDASKDSKKSDAKKAPPKRSPLKWFREAKAEFKKVTWPTPKQTLKNTSIVLGVLMVSGVAIWALDQGLLRLFNLILGIET